MGVFADQDVAYVNHVATTVGLDVVQLSGLEGFDVARDIVVRACVCACVCACVAPVIIVGVVVVGVVVIVCVLC